MGPLGIKSTVNLNCATNSPAKQKWASLPAPGHLTRWLSGHMSVLFQFLSRFPFPNHHSYKTTPRDLLRPTLTRAKPQQHPAAPPAPYTNWRASAGNLSSCPGNHSMKNFISSLERFQTKAQKPAGSEFFLGGRMPGPLKCTPGICATTWPAPVSPASGNDPQLSAPRAPPALPPAALTFLFVEDIERLEQLVFGAFHHPHPGLLLILKCPAEEKEPQLSQIPPPRLQNCPRGQAGDFLHLRLPWWCCVCCSDRTVGESRHLLGVYGPLRVEKDLRTKTACQVDVASLF